MKTLDRVFGWLLALGGCGHTAGTLLWTADKPDLELWSLCASCFVFLLATVNLLRAGRPGDRALGWIALVFNVLWIPSVIRFGQLIHNMADPRVIFFLLISVGLCGMSVRTVRGLAN